MGLLTIEVEIENGRITPRGSELLPDRASGLLTILSETEDKRERRTITEFLDRWTGAFSLPENPDDDPRLSYLLKKHVK